MRRGDASLSHRLQTAVVCVALSKRFQNKSPKKQHRESLMRAYIYMLLWNSYTLSDCGPLTCTMPFKINSDLLHLLFLRTRSLFVWSWTRKKSTTCWRRWPTSRRASTASSTTRRAQNSSAWFVSTQRRFLYLQTDSRQDVWPSADFTFRRSDQRVVIPRVLIIWKEKMQRIQQQETLKEQTVEKNESLCRLNRKLCVWKTKCFSCSVWTASISTFEK